MTLPVGSHSVDRLPPCFLNPVIAILLGVDRANHGSRGVLVVSLPVIRLVQLYAFDRRLITSYLQANVIDLGQKPGCNLLLRLEVGHKDAVLMELG